MGFFFFIGVKISMSGFRGSMITFHHSMSELLCSMSTF